MNNFKKQLFVINVFFLDNYHIQCCTVRGLINGQIQLISMQSQFNVNKNKLSDAVLLGARGKVSSPRLFSSLSKGVGF